MPTWRELVTVWRELEPRQRLVGKVVGVLWVFLDAWEFIAPSPPPPWPWWVTVLLDVLVLFWLYVGRRRPFYRKWRESLRPQDLPRVDKLMTLLLPLLVANMVAWLVLGGSMLTRVVGLPSVVVLWAVVVLSAGARRPERRERKWSLPWPFNVSPPLPPPADGR